MIIEEIEKQVINLLPTSNILLDEVDYSIIEERKNDWIKLSEVTHSVVLVFDCYTNKIIFLNYMDLSPVGCLLMDISQL